MAKNDIPKFEDTMPLDEQSRETSSVPKFEDTEPVEASQSDARDFAMKVAEGGAFGLQPYIDGSLEAVGQAVGVKGLGGPMKNIDLQEPSWLDTDKLSNAYETGYKGSMKQSQEIQDRSPYLSLAGNLAGGVATGSAISKLAGPALEAMPNVATMLRPAQKLGDLSKVGTMDFTTAAKIPSYLSRVGTEVVNNAPLATAIGLAQPTQEVGLNMPERLQNATIANALNIPFAAGVEALPAAGRAAKKVGDKVWDVLPPDTKAGIKAGFEGIGPFSKKAKQTYEVVNNRLVNFFSNKVIPEERKAYLKQLSDKNQRFEIDLATLNNELKTVQDEMLNAKKMWSENQLTALGDNEKKIMTMNRILIDDRKKAIEGQISKLKKSYEDNMNSIKNSLDGEYNNLKQAQKDDITANLKVLESRDPAEFDTQLQQTLLGVKDKLGSGYDTLEKELGEKQIRFNINEPLSALRTKLEDLEKTSLRTDQINVKDLGTKVLDELETFAGDGSIGYDEYKSLLNGMTDPKTGKRIDSALKDIRSRANGLPVQQKYMKAMDEFEEAVRARQIDHLNEIGETKLASDFKDLNKKYKDYKFYEGKFLNLSDKKTLDNQAIILKNPETRSRFLEAGKKGFLNEGLTGKGLAGESLIQELGASANPEVNQLSKLIQDYYEKYRVLGNKQVQETPDMLGIKALMDKLNANKQIDYANPEAIVSAIPEEKAAGLGVKSLLDTFDKYAVEKSNLENYSRRSRLPDYLESEDFVSPLREIQEHRKNIRYAPESIPDIENINAAYEPQISKLKNQTRILEQGKAELNNPKINDFLDKAIYNDKPLEDLQKEVRNLIISGNSDRNAGGLGTDVEVLKNLVGRITKYANDYEQNYGVPLGQDVKNMVDKLASAENKLSGSMLISGSKGNVVAGPSAIASLSNGILHTLAYLTPNKSIQSVSNVAGSAKKALLERVQQYKTVESALKNYNTSIQDLKNADTVKRAAVLNSLMQNPDMREKVTPDALKKMFGEDIGDESK